MQSCIVYSKMQKNLTNATLQRSIFKASRIDVLLEDDADEYVLRDLRETQIKHRGQRQLSQSVRRINDDRENCKSANGSCDRSSAGDYRTIYIDGNEKEASPLYDQPLTTLLHSTKDASSMNEVLQHPI